MSNLMMSGDFRECLSRIPDLDPELFLESCKRPLPEGFRINTIKSSEENVLKRLRQKGFVFEKIPWARYGYILRDGGELGKTLEHMAGLIYLQGPVSMAPVEVLDPKPGEIVLDLCAAPGSKSTQIAQLLENMGVLVANDVNHERIKALSSNLQRFGVINCVITLTDGRKYPRFARGFFDKVLIDVPCSSLGIISKNWGIAKSWSLGMVERLSRIQYQLLEAGFNCLKPGGVLVYSTCTLTVEENELVIDRLLKNYKNAKLEDIRLPSLKSRNGVVEWSGRRLNPDLEKAVRIMPYDNWAEGFFIAKIIKEVGGNEVNGYR
ncbi:MAG: RsmB/NOP family class I SAM-dependent RNA methyltransferase [Nitrososphaeria archaeon]|nr:RsmB/NOP family class I SAM-dependent RNA methyltransferase [Aigarchaeota archaeon]MCX8187105.1 RsmB/NOP family class I SAM-dependent RNA methyltransferase [Nitrososphaeria archaeon]MDW8021442.1 RsmB/NOP family class I SAM-dependent RNA methyltransferase [Nitrososphaerota archaeon]